MKRDATAGILLALSCLAALSATGRAEPPRGRVIADRLFTVADDFIVDVYHNGVKVPDAKRTLLHEVFGATAERIDIEVREGDWVVFNVVNNRLRWGGASYFGVTGAGRIGRGLHDRTGRRSVVVLRRHGEGVRVHRRPGLPGRERGPADREPVGRGRRPDEPDRGRVDGQADLGARAATPGSSSWPVETSALCPDR